MRISPDQIVYWRAHGLVLNATIVYTWFVMTLVIGIAWAVGRRLRIDAPLSRWQNALEVVVAVIRRQIAEVARDEPDTYLAFIGTLFLFILVANVLHVIPGFHAPTGSLSTTAALAGLVFLAVPFHGVRRRGLRGYLHKYVEPTWFMLPFNVLGELSRTLALAVRLYGNMMSGAVIGAILLAIAPLLFPVLMQLLGLLTGVIQAYIFAVLALVYITSATAAHEGGVGAAQEE